jgi:hypothetical protein
MTSNHQKESVLGEKQGALEIEKVATFDFEDAKTHADGPISEEQRKAERRAT